MGTFPKRLQHFPFPPLPRTRAPVSASLPAPVIVSFLLIAVLVGVRWCLLVVICIFIMINDVERHSVCFWAVRMCLEECPV